MHHRAAHPEMRSNNGTFVHVFCWPMDGGKDMAATLPHRQRDVRNPEVVNGESNHAG